MNRSAQKQVLIILLILLSLCLGGLVYWYFFNYKCGVLPNEFEFLEKFNTRNECRQKEYEIKGVIYNIREKEGDVIFDLNIWDKDTRESSYYENLGLPKNSFKGNFELTEGNWSAVKAKLILYGSGRKEIEIDELKMTEEEYSEVFNTVYEAITESPLVSEKIPADKFPLEEINAVFTSIQHRDLFPEDVERLTEVGITYLPEIFDNYTNMFLYRPWILSYLYNQGKFGGRNIEIRKNEIEEMLVAIYEESERQESSREGLQCSNGKTNGLRIDTSNYQKSKSFACLMIYQIAQNIDLQDFELIKKHCNLEFFEESIDSYMEEIDFTQKYTMSDYLDILEREELLKNIENRDSPLHSSNTTSILADTYGARRLYKEDLRKGLEERINFVLSYIINHDSLYLKNICAISYFSNLVLKEDVFKNNEQILLMNKKVNELFFPINTEMFKLVDDDVYGSMLCLEEYGGLDKVNMEKLIRVVIFKTVELDLYRDEILGIWKNLEYDIRINARFLKLLILNREILL